MEELLEESFKCDGFDNTPFTGKKLLAVKQTEHLYSVTREGGLLFQCHEAAHFLDDEGLEVYLQNWDEGRGSDSFFFSLISFRDDPTIECHLQPRYQKVARPSLSGMGRKNTKSIKFLIPPLDGSLGNVIQLIAKHSDSSYFQCSKKWNVRIGLRSFLTVIFF